MSDPQTLRSALDRVIDDAIRAAIVRELESAAAVGHRSVDRVALHAALLSVPLERVAASVRAAAAEGLIVLRDDRVCLARFAASEVA